MITKFVVVLSYQCFIHLVNNLFTAEDIDEVEVQVGVLEDTILVHDHDHDLGSTLTLAPILVLIPAPPCRHFTLVVRLILCCLMCNAWRLIWSSTKLQGKKPFKVLKVIAANVAGRILIFYVMQCCDANFGQLFIIFAKYCRVF